MFLQEEPIICPDQKRECVVVVNISNSHPEWIAINPCLVKWEADEWHQTKRIEVTTVQDYVHKNEDRQVHLKTQVTGTTSELYQDYDPADIFIESKKDGIRLLQPPEPTCSVAPSTVCCEPHRRTPTPQQYPRLRPDR